jgi:hypothetical protein
MATTARLALQVLINHACIEKMCCPCSHTYTLHRDGRNDSREQGTAACNEHKSSMRFDSLHSECWVCILEVCGLSIPTTILANCTGDERVLQLLPVVIAAAVRGLKAPHLDTSAAIDAAHVLVASVLLAWWQRHGQREAGRAGCVTPGQHTAGHTAGPFMWGRQAGMMGCAGSIIICAIHH